MDIRLIFLIGWFIFTAGFIWGFVRGMIFGTHLAVKAYLKEQNAFDGPLPDAWNEYYQAVRQQLAGSNENRDAREWTRARGLPFNAETLSLYKNLEYRRSVDGTN